VLLGSEFSPVLYSSAVLKLHVVSRPLGVREGYGGGPWECSEKCSSIHHGLSSNNQCFKFNPDMFAMIIKLRKRPRPGTLSLADRLPWTFILNYH